MLANILTLSRILLIVPGIILVNLGLYYLASFVFGIAVLTDFFDGFIARLLGQESFLGKFLDPFADKIIYLTALYLFLELGYISFLPVFLIIFRELIALGLGPSVFKKNGSILAGKIKNIVQFLSILIVLFFQKSIYSTIVIWISVIASLFSALIMYLENLDHIKSEFKVDKKKMLPNLITLSRLIFLMPFMMFLYNGDTILALVILFLAMISDVLDGYVARKTDSTTVFGSLLDPIVDKVLYLSILTIFISFNYISSVPVILIVFREFLITGLRSICLTEGYVISANKFGKIKTFIQNISVYLILFLGGSIYSEILAYIVAIVTIVSSFNYLKVMFRILKDNE